MKVTYDKKVDAKYITIRRGKVFRTIKKESYILFDYNEKDEVIGIEILNSSKHPICVTTVDGKFYKYSLPGFIQNNMYMYVSF